MGHTVCALATGGACCGLIGGVGVVVLFIIIAVISRDLTGRFSKLTHYPDAPSLVDATAESPGYALKIVLNSTGGVTASCS